MHDAFVYKTQVDPACIDYNGHRRDAYGGLIFGHAAEAVQVEIGHGISLLRILTDRGTEYGGKVENYAYQLYLAIEDVDHTKTKANCPQTSGILECFHRTHQRRVL